MINTINNYIFGNNGFGNRTNIRIDTRNTDAMSTNSNQFRLPFGYESAAFRFPKNKNVLVNWGDGTESFHASQSDNIIHTYANPGIYIVSMRPEKGGYIGISQESTVSDRIKILEVLHWGDAYIERNGFQGCINLTLDNVDDYPQFYQLAFGHFRACTSLTRINNFELWNFSELTNISSMFRDASNFNQDMSMFDMSNMSNITTMDGMFRGATNFKQDVSMWNFNKNVILNLFMNGVIGYPPEFYSNLLIKFASSFIGVGRTANKILNMGNNKYTALGASARAALVADGWTIVDGGMI